MNMNEPKKRVEPSVSLLAGKPYVHSSKMGPDYLSERFKAMQQQEPKAKCRRVK